MILLPYKNGSAGAGDLAEALGIKQVKRTGSKFKGSKEKLVINWGSSSSTEEVDKCEVLNKPEAVAIATNKLSWLRHIYNKNEEGRTHCNTPRFMTNFDAAITYIQAGHKIVCRTVLNGHSGEGIVIASTVDELVPAPLYTEYCPKKREYRVHVFLGEVADVQRKARDHDIPDEQVNWQVRNHANGFVYVRDENIAEIPRNVLQQAVLAVNYTGLDFGAADVVYNEKNNLATVLEINTAPGLTGATLEGYKERLAQFGEEYQKALAAKKYGAGSWAQYVTDNTFDIMTTPTQADPLSVVRTIFAREQDRLNAERGFTGDWAELATRNPQPAAFPPSQRRR